MNDELDKRNRNYYTAGEYNLVMQDISMNGIILSSVANFVSKT